MRNLIDSTEVTKATTRPTAPTASSVLVTTTPPSTSLAILSTLQPNMTGMAMKKLNSLAATREQPQSRPPMIVEPEREVPGTMARHWKQPILKAVSRSSSSTSCTRRRVCAPCLLLRRSITIKITP